MKIHIYLNDNGTYHVAINTNKGCEDCTCADWQAVRDLLAFLPPLKK